MMEWYKLKDNMPESYTAVLFTTKDTDGEVIIHGCLDDGENFLAYGTLETWPVKEVVYWCYAPKVPAYDLGENEELRKELPDV